MGKNSWEQLEEMAGDRLIKVKPKTALESIEDIGKAMKTKQKLEALGVGIPEYTQEQKKEIWDRWNKLSKEFENAKQK